MTLGGVAVLLTALNWFKFALYAIAGIFGLIGAAQAATTREDAFTAADRQQKWVWVGLLVLSAFFVVIGQPLIFLSWVGLVIIGLYWWDVRPQLRSLINGSGGW